MAIILNYGKAPIYGALYTRWSPTVRVIVLAPCTLRFRPYFMIDWMNTVPVKNKVHGKLTKYQRDSFSFTISAYLLPLVTTKKSRLKEKHLVMQTNIQNDLQQWDQRPRQLTRRLSVLFHSRQTGYSTGD